MTENREANKGDNKAGIEHVKDEVKEVIEQDNKNKQESGNEPVKERGSRAIKKTQKPTILSPEDQARANEVLGIKDKKKAKEERRVKDKNRAKEERRVKDKKKAKEELGVEDKKKAKEERRVKDKNRAKKLNRFLYYLEKHYKVTEISIEDLFYKQYKLKGQKAISIYESRTKLHASRIYSMVLFHLSSITKRNQTSDANSNGENEFARKRVDYYDKHIKHIEKNIGPELEPALLKFLYMLGNAYATTEDYMNFIVTFKKYIKTWSRLRNEELVKLARPIASYEDDISERVMYEVSKKTKKIYGNDPQLINAFVEAINYGFDDEPCLILGETGTGKEIVANLMHQISDRKNNNFWAVNCGGFTESLFNSEIQGIHWGAATNVGTRLGAFLRATGRENDTKKNGYHLKGKTGKKNIGFYVNGKPKDDPTKDELRSAQGTLFLDEINSLPLGVQSVLLRILQEKEVMVVGEDKKRKYAAKVICASNINLSGKEEIEGFRQDLYHRVAKGVVVLPSLRQMTDSIPDIAQEMIDDMVEKYGYRKVKVSSIAIRKMIKYDWPGNHRQLENVLYQGLKETMLNNEKTLKSMYLKLLKTKKENTSISRSLFTGKTHAEVEKMFMEYLLDQAKGNKSEMIRLGGFNSRSPVYNLLKKHDLE